MSSSRLPALPSPSAGGRPLLLCGRFEDTQFLFHLLERSIPIQDATLLGWSLVGGEWPTLLPAEGLHTQCRIALGLSDGDWQRLDAYAGVAERLYERLLVAVEVGDRTQSAWAYRATEHAANRYGAPR